MSNNEAPSSPSRCWDEATLNGSGRSDGLCDYVPAGTPRTREGLESLRCSQPAAYVVTSSRSVGLVWDVCVDHAPEARTFRWLATIQSAPVR